MTNSFSLSVRRYCRRLQSVDGCALPVCLRTLQIVRCAGSLLCSLLYLTPRGLQTSTMLTWAAAATNWLKICHLASRSGLWAIMTRIELSANWFYISEVLVVGGRISSTKSDGYLAYVKALSSHDLGHAFRYRAVSRMVHRRVGRENMTD